MSMWKVKYPTGTSPTDADAIAAATVQTSAVIVYTLYDSMAMEMDKIELMVELQVFTHIHDQRAVHRQFIPDTQ